MASPRRGPRPGVPDGAPPTVRYPDRDHPGEPVRNKPTESAPAGIDLADPAFWARPHDQRLAAFAALRRLDAPVYFAARPGSARRPQQGFYALVRHEDVVAASRRPELFISAPGVTTPEPARWVRAVFGDSMVNLDDPRH